jgi:hypothetical protein
MKARIPLMIQDPLISSITDMEKVTEGFDPIEPFFLDGPVTSKIAVLDFSEDGQRLPGAKFQQLKQHKMGRYVDSSGKNLYEASGQDIYSPEFMQVSVFATILKTIYMLQEHETLGRELTWAFNAPQLLVIPRAGDWENAFYQRETHSLQFFYFTPENSQKPIYTCLSRDIVAHETGHAIVDGIVPDLNNACSPQALAIHEAIADMTALLMAFQSHSLVEHVLRTTKGSIENTKPFSGIGEQFGEALNQAGRPLRNLHNKKNLNASDKEDGVRDDEPHALSEVFSGALYSVFEQIFYNLRKEFAQRPKYAKLEDPTYSASGATLAEAAQRLKRMIFRGLDLCPPGETSFAGCARAMIAADLIAYPDPDSNNMRDWLRKEFKKRYIIRDEAELDVKTDFSADVTKCIDSKKLFSGDWLAYDFVNKNRELFCIPTDREPIAFEVRPRLDVTKKYDDRNPRGKMGRELIFKVAWDQIEESQVGFNEIEKRKITVGTSLVFDWNSCTILARLTSAPANEFTLTCQGLDGKQRELAIAESTNQRISRDRLLTRLNEEGLLRTDKQAFVRTSKVHLAGVGVEVKDGVLSTYSMANLLHIVGRRVGE